MIIRFLIQKVGLTIIIASLVGVMSVTTSAVQDQKQKEQHQQQQQAQQQQRQVPRQQRQAEPQQRHAQQQERQAARQQRQSQGQQQHAQQQQQRQATRQQRQSQGQQQHAQQQQQRQAARQQRQAQAQQQHAQQQASKQQQAQVQANNPDQQRRLNVFRARFATRERTGQQREQWFRDRGRLAHSRFEEEYLEHLRRDRISVAFVPDFYYYTAPRYRFRFDGGFYYLSSYGADSLRQAIRYGYEEGFTAGQADRSDRAPFGYTQSFAYQDASWGYSGYCDLSQYQYYFRQGFLRGYRDGFYGRYRYGVYSNGVAAIAATVLNQIFSPLVS